jgi:hypothetical protein
VRRQAAVTCVLLGALAGCAQSPARSDSDWSPGVQRGQAFDKILVVGVAPTLNQRCSFEKFMVSELRGQATQVISSCNTLSHSEPLTRENIERVIAEHGVDAVLATRLVDFRGRAQEGGTEETRGDAYYKATDVGYAYGYGYFGAYGMPVVYGEFETAPSLLNVTGEVTVLTQLFETGNAAMIYQVTTQARGLDSRLEALAEVSSSVAQRMRRDGVIR